MSMFFMTDDYWQKLDPESRLKAIISLAVPWYFNFYAGWLSKIPEMDDCVSIVHYEDLLENPEQTIRGIAKKFQLPERCSPERAILESNSQNTLKNAAVTGRGRDLPAWAITQLQEFASFYPQGMFDLIGIKSPVRP